MPAPGSTEFDVEDCPPDVLAFHRPMSTFYRYCQCLTTLIAAVDVPSSAVVTNENASIAIVVASAIPIIIRWDAQGEVLEVQDSILSRDDHHVAPTVGITGTVAVIVVAAAECGTENLRIKVQRLCFILEAGIAEKRLEQFSAPVVARDEGARPARG